MIFGDQEAEAIFGGMVLEAAGGKDQKIFEEAASAGAVGGFAGTQLRSQGMACALAWIENGDYSAGALLDSVTVIADLDGDDELTEDEEDFYNELLAEVGEALVALGADAGNVQTFIDDEDDDEGEKIGGFLAGKMDEIEAEDDEIISNYALNEEPVLESTIKVIRGGKIVLKKKRTRRVKLSAAQKAGLKKARRKAFTGAAKLARKKSMKLRKKRGM